MIRFTSLDPDCHIGPDAARVMDLFERASDYVQLESGKLPDLDFLRETFDGPPTIAPEDRFVIGLEDDTGKLRGTAAYIRNFYTTDEWYMGLLILDPESRNQGFGAQAAQMVIDHVKRENGKRLRIAVLDANKNGRRFWERQGFKLERTVPADPDRDDHPRHVLKIEMGERHAP